MNAAKKNWYYRIVYCIGYTLQQANSYIIFNIPAVPARTKIFPAAYCSRTRARHTVPWFNHPWRKQPQDKKHLSRINRSSGAWLSAAHYRGMNNWVIICPSQIIHRSLTRCSAASWSLVTGSLVMPDTLAAWLLLADRASTTRTRCQAIFFMSIVEIAETRSGAARRGATKRTVLIVMATYRCHRKIDSSSDERIILTHIDEEGQLHLNAHLCERIRGRRVAREICMLIYSARSAPCIYMRARLCSRFFRVPTIFFLFFAVSLSVIRFPPENLTSRLQTRHNVHFSQERKLVEGSLFRNGLTNAWVVRWFLEELCTEQVRLCGHTSA